MRTWTVVRFPVGAWSYGGKPTDPDYAECEVWTIEASTGPAAVKKAQARRSAAQRKLRAQPQPEAKGLK